MDHYMKDYMGHFYPIWIKHWGNIELYGPSLPQIKEKLMG